MDCMTVPQFIFVGEAVGPFQCTVSVTGCSGVMEGNAISGDEAQSKKEAKKVAAGISSRHFERWPGADTSTVELKASPAAVAAHVVDERANPRAQNRVRRQRQRWERQRMAPAKLERANKGVVES